MHQYFQEVQHLLNIVAVEEQSSMRKAAQLISERIQGGGILQLFGCGHSHLLAQEAFFRAGGLVPVETIFIEPLMLQAGALTSSNNEKDPNFIANHRHILDFKPNDVLIIISTSGRNVVPIDVAILAKEAGVLVISLQSLEYKEHAATKHKSGQRLEEVVNVVLNTHIPIGDGVLWHDSVQYGPASSTVGSAILNTTICQVIEILASTGEDLPVFESANLDGSKERNELMIERYSNRINF
ncbi:SIS domain-containing protein [Viridibacillus sp. YIM B01967]|uniref:SIS domain-containing protein n=1 Tax=Viridibacillus soli TaxID=2798301 RepID=A0ABS1H1X0_9BACL|nr:SIS domain-containing protein [Viridibacillus soli]MBK3493396.1 SIS domain-containing protein [Viridibacillus soli]